MRKIKEEVKQVANAIIPESFKDNHFFALMLFYRGYEIGLPNGNAWMNTHNIFFEDYQTALDAYANIPCPASQLIEAHTEEELKQKMKQMLLNYKDKKWLEENLYIYI